MSREVFLDTDSTTIVRFRTGVAEIPDLVVVRLRAEMTAESFEVFLDQFDRSLEFHTGVRLGIVIDSLQLQTADSACAFAMRQYMRRQRSNFAQMCVATGIALQSRIVKLFLQGVFAIQKPASQMGLFHTDMDAIAFVCGLGAYCPSEAQLHGLVEHHEGMAAEVDAGPDVLYAERSELDR
jgi:hypothetical protein